MNTGIDEKISQFLDGELDHADLDHFLHKYKQNPDLQKKMSRYQLTGHVLRSDNVTVVDKGFLHKISQQLAQEPHHLLPKQAVRKKPLMMWQKSSAAIAATFVIGAIIVSQQSGLENLPEQQLIAKNQTPPPVINKKAVKSEMVAAAEPQPSQHERLKAYLQAHSDDLYTHGSVNYQPHARVASFGGD